jgi:BolA family transcriptional regulator, general stress-responsive regulator
MTMNELSRIQNILKEKLQAIVVEVTDQSDRHKHHKQKPENSGHYDAVVVSDLFLGKSLMQQHRLVYEALAVEMQTTIHALSLSTMTPDQWASK